MRLNTLLLFALIMGLVACQQTPTYETFEENTAQLRNPELKPFYHHVASGDPMQDRVILWTRVTPDTKLPEIEVEWEIAADTEFNSLAGSGTFTTSPERDYTVKVDAQNLQPGTQYYYRFKALDATSPVGKTMTAPKAADEVKFAVVSCSNYEFGYFNGYGRIADENNLHAVIHLGDYIYEYGPGVYGDTTIGRIHVPDHEIITLQDYRDRYAQYRLDPDLQAAHANHPFITVWDDHEISNNSYTTGAQNHQPEEEGDYETRKAVARQVYYEWLPIRQDETLYRNFSFGELADLVMLDGRLAGRTQPADSVGDPSLNSEDHAMLGNQQVSWLKEQLNSSNAQWKVIGNQVIFSRLDWGFPGFRVNLDSWDGYPREQKELAGLFRQTEDVVIITGDTHSAWAFESVIDTANYNAATGEGAFAVEFGTTSINSGNSNERAPTDSVLAHEKKIVNTPVNPHLKYANMRDHGYLLLTLTPEQARADYKFVPTLKERTNEVATQQSMIVQSGEVKLQEVTPNESL